MLFFSFNILETKMTHIDINSMVQKLEVLSEAKLIEVNDFVDFLISKKERESLSNLYSKASDQSFSKLWDNKDDEVYNDL
jgi:energy-converting hydrogenase A subunit M